MLPHNTTTGIFFGSNVHDSETVTVTVIFGISGLYEHLMDNTSV